MKNDEPIPKALLDLLDPYEGNNLWSLYCSRVGRTPIFTSAAQMRYAFDTYVQWCANHPLEGKEYVKSGIAAGHCYIVQRKHLVTEFGFTQFIGVNSTYLIDRKKMYEEQHEKYKDDESLEMLAEIESIRAWIREDMDKNAIAGFYDSNYVAKLRQLRDYKDYTSNGETVQGNMKVEVLETETVNNIVKLKNIADKKPRRKAKGLDNLKDNEDD